MTNTPSSPSMQHGDTSGNDEPVTPTTGQLPTIGAGIRPVPQFDMISQSSAAVTIPENANFRISGDTMEGFNAAPIIDDTTSQRSFGAKSVQYDKGPRSSLGQFYNPDFGSTSLSNGGYKAQKRFKPLTN